MSAVAETNPLRPPHPLPLILLSLLALATGCHSTPTAKNSYRDMPGTFADQGARAAYVSSRGKELTGKGVSASDAAARASREWFASAPAASESPTPQELMRRNAQAAFEADLAKQQESRTR